MSFCGQSFKGIAEETNDRECGGTINFCQLRVKSLLFMSVERASPGCTESRNVPSGLMVVDLEFSFGNYVAVKLNRRRHDFSLNPLDQNGAKVLNPIRSAK